MYEYIYVLKTNINSEALIKSIETEFNSIVLIKCWSVDIEDIDNVLRIESNDLKEHDIIQMVKSKGFECEPLLD